MRRLARILATSFIASAGFLTGCGGTQSMTIERADFGVADGQPVSLYTLTNRHGLVARITNYGAIVTELHVPDRNGRLDDVVLGFDTLAEYVDHNPYFGCMAGRCANRIANGRFTLDGVTHQLNTNNGPHHLHGGVKGFDKVVWDATPRTTAEGPSLRLTYLSPDGEEHYPGNLLVTVTYTLTHDNALRVETTATTDAPTIVNIVHHSYWNLAGHNSGTILAHQMQLPASSYTPADATLIPTGVIAPVTGTPFDFTMPKAMGEDIGQLPASGDDPGGYDLNYVVDGDPGAMRLAAIVHEPGSGRVMTIHADQPGIQFYTGNFLSDVPGKDGAIYPRHGGFCLETQKFPDSINKEGRPGWPSVILRPGQTYRHVMEHRFSTR
ncbi:MAG: galactose mutarotase [Phycisphaerales bacterium]|nr:galactose mutarotase [Phycisphaerales bacterium]